MKIYYSEQFVENVQQLPSKTKKIIRMKLKLLLENPQHPSLRTKKIKGKENIFEASITMGIRITWQYFEEGILLRNIGEHVCLG
jgi:mRNA-degrading endonuclease RelE of RelBE toxin-antitoxin system